MAYQEIRANQPYNLPSRLWHGINALLSTLLGAMIAASSANRRLQLVERLNAKSDAELAKLGIRREDIVRRVFLDMSNV